MSDESQGMSVEAQLAVLRTKMDQLLELNKSRGEDHENRIRALENNSVTKKAAYTTVVLVCMVTAALTNVVAFWLK